MGGGYAVSCQDNTPLGLLIARRRLGVHDVVRMTHCKPFVVVWVWAGSSCLALTTSFTRHRKPTGCEL